MSTAIPDFARRVQPLNNLLEDAYRQKGRRTKRCIRNVALYALGWGTTHERAFKDLQQSLCSAVELAFHDPSKTVCIYTDASDQYWSAVITQVTAAALDCPIENESHEPLAFLGSEFRGAQKRWSTFEKEAFAIFQAFEKMDYVLLQARPARLYTDHRNLLYIFAPHAVCSTGNRW